MPKIPVIDIFAGPGGLGEGFSSLLGQSNKPAFEICLSIEKDPFAHATLKLRTFFRELLLTGVNNLKDYYALLRQEITLQELYDNHPIQEYISDRKAWLAELGGKDFPAELVREHIHQALGGKTNFVLIGGPPCQAYSLVGRSRNKGNPDYKPEEDNRQTLYVEYLQILADHQPAVFVMENVKGLLSAKVGDQFMFQRIVADLRQPARALEREGRVSHGEGHAYHLHSFVEPGDHTAGDSRRFLIQAEKYGIPQARHRVIILGIREDLVNLVSRTLIEKQAVPIEDVIKSLPPLRSGLSKKEDSFDAWLASLSNIVCQEWFNGEGSTEVDSDLIELIKELANSIQAPTFDRGKPFICHSQDSFYRSDWFLDSNLEGVCNHESRAHIQSDLQRYFYAACFALVREHSPALSDFPPHLLPNHKNVRTVVENTSNTVDIKQRLTEGAFSDRFRVQVWGKPATTIMSHISKDGHYYIHPDPLQCRSLTVREAARIQTFPDNYFFCGPRTSQYQQVGNAVPPLLAVQLAEIVHDVLQQAGSDLI